MHPYAAKQLVARLRDADLAISARATESLAELELWCRGGADYGDPLAFTLAIRSHGGAEAAASGGRPQESGGRDLHGSAEAATAFDFLRAPVFLCMAPFCTALSIFETRSRCSVGDRVGVATLDRRFEPAEWVLTVLVKSRFSVRSRSLRSIRFSVRLCWPCRKAPGGVVPAPGGRRL